MKNISCVSDMSFYAYLQTVLTVIDISLLPSVNLLNVACGLSPYRPIVLLILRTNPNNIDSDGDTLNDTHEIVALGTNATNADTDGDRYLDGEEIAAGTNALDPLDYPGKIDPPDYFGTSILILTISIVLLLTSIGILSVLLLFVLYQKRKPNDNVPKLKNKSSKSIQK